TVTSSTFTTNLVTGGASTTAIGGSAGGGLDNFGGATLTLSNSTFTGNQAVVPAGNYFGIGAARENDAGLDGRHPSRADITSCTFTGNIAFGAAGTTANGGAIANEGPDASMTIMGSTVSNNQAIGGDGGDGENTLSQGIGGGIVNGGGSMLTLIGCTIK